MSVTARGRLFIRESPKTQLRRPHSDSLVLIGGSGRRLSDATAATFRVHELCEGAAKILFCRRHAEAHPSGGHLRMKFLQVGDAEAELDASRFGKESRGKHRARLRK